ncbi:hypothetical protein FAM18108_02081 [Lacticaseibacillus paracasei]|nr:hypothetical protein FAM18108_02081 [Lacticaseibacillus paracasei]
MIEEIPKPLSFIEVYLEQIATTAKQISEKSKIRMHPFYNDSGEVTDMIISYGLFNSH